MSLSKELPEGKFKIIYADPPWKYNDKRQNPDTDRPAKYGGISYDVMDTEDICNIPVSSIADDDCILFLWATFPNMPSALKVIEAWGFKYKTLGFSWIKMNKNQGYFFGIGSYTKSNCEVCLIATKGKPVIMSDKISSVIVSPIHGHSKKPDIVRTKIVQLMGDIPRIELFARTRVHGWTTFGNDEKLDLEPLEQWN